MKKERKVRLIERDAKIEVRDDSVDSSDDAPVLLVVGGKNKKQ